MPSYSRETINRMHTKINIDNYWLHCDVTLLCWNWNAWLLNSTWGYNFNWRNTGKQTACSNLSCTLVMEEGRQKSKRLTYMAKFKREVMQCTEDRGNRKAAAIFGVDNSNVWLWQWSAGVRHHKRNWLDPRKDNFLKLMMQSSRSFMRLKTGLFVSYDLLHEEAIKKARSLTIPRSRFKASKGWAIRFMCRMGLALRR